MRDKKKIKIFTTVATFIAIFWSFLIIPIDLSGSFTDLLGYFTLFMPLLFLIMVYQESEDIRSNEKKLVSPVTFNFTVMIVFAFSSPFTLLLLPEEYHSVGIFPLVVLILVYNMFYFLNNECFVNYTD